MKKILIGLLVVLCGCVSLLPRKDRVAPYTGTAPGTKNELYRKALVWFAKNYNDSNRAIKVRKENWGRIVGQGFIRCSPRIGVDGVNFVVDFQANANSFSLGFEDIALVYINTQNGVRSVVGPGSTKGLNSTRTECIQPLAVRLAKALGGRLNVGAALPETRRNALVHRSQPAAAPAPQELRAVYTDAKAACAARGGRLPSKTEIRTYKTADRTYWTGTAYHHSARAMWVKGRDGLHGQLKNRRAYYYCVK